MDPPHVTEFASERYFEKLNQLRQPGQQQKRHHTNTSTVGSATFILPLRESRVSQYAADPRPIEQKRPEKNRRFGFRSLLHPKQSAAPGELLHKPYTPIEDPGRRCVSFTERFHSLPNELQAQILSALPLHDILNLRMVSRSWHTLVTLHEAPIVRHHLDHHIPAYAQRLYRVDGPAYFNLRYLCSLWHRLHVAAKLSHLVCEWTTKEIFLRRSEAQRLEFAPQRERMRRRLIPILFTIFHFFEMYRKLHLKHMRDHDGHGLRLKPYTLNPIEVQIMSMYDDATLLRVHQVFPLVIASFCRRLRPPTYVGRVERSFRGYLRDKPSDEIHSAVLCIGGLRQVEKIWEVKGYNTRRNAVDAWFNSLPGPSSPDKPLPQVPPKHSRLPFRGIGRKKSTLFTDTPAMPHDGHAHQSTIPAMPSLVFQTSLSEGMPMPPLPPDDVGDLLSDLPILQHIWLATAEALILDRRIVERPQDIKRNAQVMLDLIREDGMAEEDEWWYGSGGHESTRPPAEATEDDPEAL